LRAPGRSGSPEICCSRTCAPDLGNVAQISTDRQVRSAISPLAFRLWPPVAEIARELLILFCKREQLVAHRAGGLHLSHLTQLGRQFAIMRNAFARGPGTDVTQYVAQYIAPRQPPRRKLADGAANAPRRRAEAAANGRAFCAARHLSRVKSSRDDAHLEAPRRIRPLNRKSPAALRLPGFRMVAGARNHRQFLARIEI